MVSCKVSFGRQFWFVCSSILYGNFAPDICDSQTIVFIDVKYRRNTYPLRDIINILANVTSGELSTLR